MTRPDYVRHPHPYSPFTDDFGMTVPACTCRRERAIPGGTECADCLIERVHAEDRRVAA